MRLSPESFDSSTLNRTVKFPASVMVWGCMSSRGVGNLHFIDGTVNAQKYQDILKENLLPTSNKQFSENLIFQQDGASSHTAKSTKSWLENNNVHVIIWPSGSPDLSPIESLWGVMKKELRNQRPSNKDALKSKLQEIWDKISNDECQSLMNSMQKRVQAVIQSKGDVTPY